MAAEVVHTPLQGTWFRHVPSGYAALGVSRGHAGRLHRIGTVAIYLADSAQTAWAEWYRWLAEWAHSPVEHLPRDMYRIHVDLTKVADLRSAAQRKVAGVLVRTRPTSRQWPAFQAAAEAFATNGAQGVLYSSAARTRSACLCVFEAGLSGLTIAGPPVRVVEPPAPPRGLRT